MEEPKEQKNDKSVACNFKLISGHASNANDSIT